MTLASDFCRPELPNVFSGEPPSVMYAHDESGFASAAEVESAFSKAVKTLGRDRPGAILTSRDLRPFLPHRYRSDGRHLQRAAEAEGFIVEHVLRGVSFRLKHKSAEQPPKTITAPAAPPLDLVNESPDTRIARIRATAKLAPRGYVPPPAPVVAPPVVASVPTPADPQELASAGRVIQQRLRTARCELNITECIRLARVRDSKQLPADPQERADVLTKFAKVFQSERAERGESISFDVALAHATKQFN